MSTLTCLLGVIALAAPPALAADAPSPVSGAAPTFEDLPAPSIELERLPPRFSWEIGVGVSYGAVNHWASYFDAWVGFGLRGGWGHHIGNSRVGFDVHAVAEGPVGVHTTLALEPHLSWDHVTDGRLLLGAGIGPAVMYHVAAGESVVLRGERDFTIEPSLVGRIGWSQTWSRVGRRLFVYLEPKVRPGLREGADGAMRPVLNPVLALVVGSGKGR